MRKFASVREGGSHGSSIARSASVQETYSRRGPEIGAQIPIVGSQRAMEIPADRESSWRDRLWLLGSRRRTEKWSQIVTRKREKLPEEENKLPKWKEMLKKLKNEARRMGKRQSKGHLEQRQGGELGNEKLMDPIVYPEPLPIRESRQEAPLDPIWQRRKVGQPSPLDLEKVRARSTIINRGKQH